MRRPCIVAVVALASCGVLLAAPKLTLEIYLYFEPETYRHVASVYTTAQTQGMGSTPESSSQQSDMYFRLEERFSDFQQVGGLTLPKGWTVRYERSGNTASEWKYDLTVQSVDGPIGH